jgi:hypothetical protein
MSEGRIFRSIAEVRRTARVSGCRGPRAGDFRRSEGQECKSPKVQSNKEVEGKEEETEEEEESSPGEAAAGELRDGMHEADGDNAETGFAATFVEGANRNVAGEIAAQGGELVVNPECEFRAVTPKHEATKGKNRVTETRKKTESRT